jgi:hypothetical protein
MRVKSPDDSKIVADRLYPRRIAREILGGASDPTLRRLEKDGDLQPVKLNKRSATGQVFYRGSDLLRLVQAR